MFLEGKEEPNIIDYINQYERFAKGLSTHYPNEEAFGTLIDFYEENSHHKKLKEVFAYALSIYPYSSDLLLKKADFLISEEKIHEAMKHLNKVSNLGNDDIELNVLMFECYVILNQIQKAQKVSDRFLSISDNQTKIEFLYEMSDIYDEHEMYSKVLDCFFEILSIKSDEEEALYKIFFWIRTTKRFEKSFQFFHDLIKKDLFHPLVWFNYGAISYQLKLYEKAKEAYYYSIALNDKYDFVFQNLAQTHIKLREFKPAIDALESLLFMTPHIDIYYLKVLADCHYKLKNDSKAKKIYKQVIQIDNSDSYSFYMIGKIYYKENNIRIAIEYIKQAIALKKNLSYIYFLAHMLFKSEQYDSSFEKALFFFDKRPNTRKYLFFFLQHAQFDQYYDVIKQALEKTFLLKKIDKKYYDFANVYLIFLENKNIPLQVHLRMFTKKFLLSIRKEVQHLHQSFLTRINVHINIL